MGGKNSLGGRTIASLQEEDFDHRLLHYQLCYGVRFNGERATLQRRRVCKALVVHSLDLALRGTGAVLKYPLEFRCENTAFAKAVEDLQPPPVLLKPNDEFRSMEVALREAVTPVDASELRLTRARTACEFLTDCKWATRPPHLSFRKLASCLTTNDELRRRLILDEVGAMLFRVKGRQNKVLISQLIDEPVSR